MHVIQKDRNGEHEPESYVTRNDGALVSTANLDAEDLRFLAAEVRDRATARKLRALARKREPAPPLPPGLYRMPHPKTGELVEVELLGPAKATADHVHVRIKRAGRAELARSVSPALLRPLAGP
jgi:hypothetical protein